MSMCIVCYPFAWQCYFTFLLHFPQKLPFVVSRLLSLPKSLPFSSVSAFLVSSSHSFILVFPSLYLVVSRVFFLFFFTLISLNLPSLYCLSLSIYIHFVVSISLFSTFYSFFLPFVSVTSPETSFTSSFLIRIFIPFPFDHWRYCHYPFYPSNDPFL